MTCFAHGRLGFGGRILVGVIHLGPALGGVRLGLGLVFLLHPVALGRNLLGRLVSGLGGDLRHGTHPPALPVWWGA